MNRFKLAVWSRHTTLTRNGLKPRARRRNRVLAAGVAVLATLTGSVVYWAETRPDAYIEPDVPWQYRWRWVFLGFRQATDESGRRGMLGYERLWRAADSDESLSPQQLAAIAAPLAVVLNGAGHRAEARLVAGTVLRALRRRANARDPLARMRAASCAVSLAYAEEDAPTAWPFMAWAVTEMLAADLGPLDSVEFYTAAHTVRFGALDWADYNGAFDDLMPFHVAAYERLFMTRPWQAAEMLNDLTWVFYVRGDTILAFECAFRAFWLGRTSRTLFPLDEPGPSIRTRVCTLLWNGYLSEMANNHADAQSAYWTAREMVRHHPQKFPERWVNACDAFLLRSRLLSDDIISGSNPDYDEDPEF